MRARALVIVLLLTIAAAHGVQGWGLTRTGLDLQDGNGVERPLVSLLFCFFF